MRVLRPLVTAHHRYARRRRITRPSRADHTPRVFCSPRVATPAMAAEPTHLRLIPDQMLRMTRPRTYESGGCSREAERLLTRDGTATMIRASSAVNLS
jgi:hypothetical protein